MSNIAIDSDDADCDDRPDEIETVAFYTVAIFMVDRAYGGPEEGGWWFDHGEPIDHIPDGINPHDLITVFDSRDDVEAARKEALAWRDTLQTQLDTYPNQGRREISSVLSTGRYAAELCVGWPKPFPEETPHYE